MLKLSASIETDDVKGDGRHVGLPVDFEHSEMIVAVCFAQAIFAWLDIVPIFGETAGRNIVDGIETIELSFVDLGPMHVARDEDDAVGFRCFDQVKHFLLFCGQVRP